VSVPPPASQAYSRPDSTIPTGEKKSWRAGLTAERLQRAASFAADYGPPASGSVGLAAIWFGGSNGNLTLALAGPVIASVASVWWKRRTDRRSGHDADR
jgi:hypothetical protein